MIDKFDKSLKKITKKTMFYGKKLNTYVCKLNCARAM